ncbi:hypothetical protein OCU04_004316 [Sclerotinia nivalis]|uniref:Uncharacterized protein n=1 Tax=Sclerotinia nivalis TaxID=352851 RepID=A0A9X0DMA7_9HELO|nr:hypothetical protein OCU04_004316 [Sclerotinia nivalis]
MDLNMWSTSRGISEPATMYKAWVTIDLFGSQDEKSGCVFAFMDTSSDDVTLAYSNRTSRSTSTCERYFVAHGDNDTGTNLTIRENGNSKIFNVSLPFAD